MSLDYDFADLLDAMTAEAADEPAPVRASFVFDHLAVAEGLGAAASVPDSLAAAGYAEAFEPFEPEPEAVPQAPSVEPAEIAAELRLAGLDAGGLALARRDFAQRNHPDRAHPAIRTAALTRMQIANAMVDEAEKRLAQRAA